MGGALMAEHVTVAAVVTELAGRAGRPGVTGRPKRRPRDA